MAGLDERSGRPGPRRRLVGAVEEVPRRCAARRRRSRTTVLAEADARQVPKTRLGVGLDQRLVHPPGRHPPLDRAPHRAPGPRNFVTGLPRTHAALRDGTVSPEQAAVIAEAVDRTAPARPPGTGPGPCCWTRPPGSTPTWPGPPATCSRSPTPSRPTRTPRRRRLKGDRAAHLGRFLSIVEDGAGGVRLRGRGTVEDAATLRTALLPLTAPAPALDPDTGEDDVDPRDHGARLWDALVTTAAHALATDLAPDTHRARPRITITTHLDTLRHRLGLGTAAPGPSRAAGTGGATGTTGAGRGGDGRHREGRIDWLTLNEAIPVTDDGLTLTPARSAGWPATPTSSRSASAAQSQVLDVGRTQRLVTTTAVAGVDRP